MEKISIFEVSTNTSKWKIPITGKSFLSVIEIYDENKNILDSDHTITQDSDYLYVDFGLDEHIGYVKYSYWEESNCDNCNNVTVNVNTPTANQIEIERINVTNIKTIEVEQKDRQIEVYQLISNENNEKTYQNYTNSVDIFSKLAADGKWVYMIESNIEFTGFIKLY